MTLRWMVIAMQGSLPQITAILIILDVPIYPVALISVYDDERIYMTSEHAACIAVVYDPPGWYRNKVSSSASLHQ